MRVEGVLDAVADARGAVQLRARHGLPARLRVRAPRSSCPVATVVTGKGEGEGGDN